MKTGLIKKKNVYPCPICGRYPKQKVEYFPTGALWTIQCKPLFRTPHVTVRHGCATPERAYYMAIKEWNRRAGDENA